jgi:Tol biopolymer transport system component
VYPFPGARCAAAAALLLVLGCGGSAPQPGSSSAGLVLVRRVGGSSELLRIRLADAAERAVTDTPEREEAWPYWSDAAGLLLFQARAAGEPNDLYLFDPQSGAERPLLRTPERDEGWQQWSRDGQRVLYAFQGGDPQAGVAWVRPSDGSGELLATTGLRDFFLRPEFTADGERVVAQRRGADGRGSWLWLLNPGRPPVRLTRDPVWYDSKVRPTRDGARFVYSRRRRGRGPYEIASIDPTGRDLRVLVGGDGRDSHSAQPSPRRDEIAYVAREGDSYDLFLADLDGSHRRALSRTPDRHELAPRWSPDGELLVVTTAPTSAGLPRLTDPEGLEQMGVAVFDRSGRELFRAPGFMPDWMPPWP